MPTGLADGFGSKEFAYAPCGAIHPGKMVPPFRLSGFGSIQLYIHHTGDPIKNQLARRADRICIDL